MDEGAKVRQTIGEFLRANGWRSNGLPDEYERWNDGTVGWAPTDVAYCQAKGYATARSE